MNKLYTVLVAGVTSFGISITDIIHCNVCPKEQPHVEDVMVSAMPTNHTTIEMGTGHMKLTGQSFKVLNS